MAVLATACAASAGDLPLSPAQVEQVTGQTGLTTKPAKYDKLGTNFVNPHGATVITLKVGTSSLYETWKAQPAMNDQAPVQGVGEDAVASKKGRYVCFKKGSLGACVVGSIDFPGKPTLVSDEQLLQLAKLAAK
ncbi:hypothetical protein [Ideonella oryzae]|uniref:DUF4367 domain-containing protein n=1 Tax=Ideonella oryzae TaxID=2937441 RepID=A0ABT1BT04_9BURK|nr:hypothetical protein [Ideonella oryzae]MCO5978682.1 hypothetical protein [Ideonella oryzae]